MAVDVLRDEEVADGFVVLVLGLDDVLVRLHVDKVFTQFEGHCVEIILRITVTGWISIKEILITESWVPLIQCLEPSIHDFSFEID